VVLDPFLHAGLSKGKPRSVELGILDDRDTTLSAKLIKSFPRCRCGARPNEPYGPKDGVLAHASTCTASPAGCSTR